MLFLCLSDLEKFFFANKNFFLFLNPSAQSVQRSESLLAFFMFFGVYFLKELKLIFLIGNCLRYKLNACLEFGIKKAIDFISGQILSFLKSKRNNLKNLIFDYNINSE